MGYDLSIITGDILNAVDKLRSRGIPFVISTDAHATGELDNVRYGVAIARRGWVRRGEVLNTRDVDAFTRAVAPVERKSRVRRHPVAR